MTMTIPRGWEKVEAPREPVACALCEREIRWPTHAPGELCPACAEVDDDQAGEKIDTRAEHEARAMEAATRIGRGIHIFRLGRTLMTPGAASAMGEAMLDPSGLLVRHEQGDWGSVCGSDWLANEDALRTRDRLFSVYQIADLGSDGADGNWTRLYVITEADRSATTILTPEEY